MQQGHIKIQDQGSHSPYAPPTNFEIISSQVPQNGGVYEPAPESLEGRTIIEEEVFGGHIQVALQDIIIPEGVESFQLPIAKEGLEVLIATILPSTHPTLQNILNKVTPRGAYIEHSNYDNTLQGYEQKLADMHYEAQSPEFITIDPIKLEEGRSTNNQTIYSNIEGLEVEIINTGNNNGTINTSKP